MAIVLCSTTVSAQINSPTADGYVERGISFYTTHNYHGALDQLDQALAMPISPDMKLRAEYFRAMSLLHSADIDAARAALTDIEDRYPASPYRLETSIALADCDFYQHAYHKAIRRYRELYEGSLPPALAHDVTYRTAYSLMMLGDDDEASAVFDALASRSNRYRTAAYFYQGYIDYRQGRYEQARRRFAQTDPATPPGNDARYFLAQMALRTGRYDEALALSRAALSAPDCSPAYRPAMQLAAGESLFRLGSKDEALPYIESYVEATPADQIMPTARYILGVTDYDRGNLDSALQWLQPVAAGCNDAMGQSAYLYIGQTYLRMGGHASEATLALEKAARAPWDAAVAETALYNYAVARTEGARVPFGSSVALFEEFLRKYPSSRYASQVQEYLVTGYMTDNNYDKALASIEKIRRPSAEILAAKQRVLYILGSRDLAAGRTARALERFTEVRKLAAHDAAMAREADLWAGDCQYRLGHYDKAATAFTQYLRQAPASEANRPIAVYDLAYTRFAQKQYAAALKLFNQIAGASGLSSATRADVYNRIADCHYYASDFSQASRAYDQAYTLNPSAGDYALFQKAVMQGMTRNYSAKLSLLDRMTEQFPKSPLIPSALLEQAETHIAMGDEREAVAAYRTLIDRYPATSQGRNAMLQLAITLMSEGDADESISLYKRVISQYPTSDEARVAADDLKRIYADRGTLDQYTRFIASVPKAPKLEVSEIDELTFRSAEKAYLSGQGTSRLERYIGEFPSGNNAAAALGYLASAEFLAGNTDSAMRYATTLAERYPDSEAAEDALAIKGDIEIERGLQEQALATFSTLARRASAQRNAVAARFGIMRASRDLQRYDAVIENADALLASSAITPAQKNEAIYSRALAYASTGHADKAVKGWEQLAKDTDDIFGAKSAYYLAQHYFDNGNLKKAQRTVEKLIDSNTPHQYWLARGYILLSDINRHQGKTFEADEYLKSLRDNYPGSETDITVMIDQRLNK